MKKTYKITNGTSFHGITIKTTINELINAIGNPSCKENTGNDKVNFEWDCETSEEKPVTIYDWKQYRPIGRDEEIEFHIGGFLKSDTETAKNELETLLNEKK